MSTQIKIKLPRVLGTVLDKVFSMSVPKAGSVRPPPTVLTLTKQTLLYFKAEACVGCDQLDMFVGRFAAAHQLDIRVIDARRGDLPEHGYGDQLILDADGRIRKGYGVYAFPTLIVTDPLGRIHAALVGGDIDEHTLGGRLKLA
ncbi:TlpA family protein disulfide reductase [Deinococcus puniceus]|nr:hypothetical protein [Deinococcus puniceus]